MDVHSQPTRLHTTRKAGYDNEHNSGRHGKGVTDQVQVTVVLTLALLLLLSVQQSGKPPGALSRES